MTKTQPAGERRVDWFAAGLGLVLAVAVQLVGASLFFSGHRGELLAQGLLTLAAVLAGGFLAGYVGPPRGAVWNGMIVGATFIVVEELAGALGPVGPIGSAGLDTVGLVVDDVLVLTGATLGGLTARVFRRIKLR
jgi:hypothetical protein